MKTVRLLPNMYAIAVKIQSVEQLTSIRAKQHARFWNMIRTLASVPGQRLSRTQQLILFAVKQI